MEKSADAFRTISEVAEDLSLPQHVLRFWETRFPQIRPLKRAGGRRYYRPMDVVLLRMIRQLLYDQGYTIKGVQRLLKEQGAKGVREGTSPPPDLGAPGFAHDPGPVDTDTIAILEDEPETDALERELPDSLLATLDTLPAGGAALPNLDRLRAALATIEECERILRALRG